MSIKCSGLLTQEITKVLFVFLIIMAHAGDTPYDSLQPLPPGHESYLFDPLRVRPPFGSLIDISTPSGNYGSSLSAAAAPFQPRMPSPNNPWRTPSQPGASSVGTPRSQNPFATAHDPFSNAPFLRGPRMPVPRKADPKSVSFWTDHNDDPADCISGNMSSTPFNPSARPNPVSSPSPAAERNPLPESDVDSALSPYRLLINSRCDAEKKLDCIALQLRRNLAECERDAAAESVAFLKAAFTKFEDAQNDVTAYLRQAKASEAELENEAKYFNVELKMYIDLLNYANDRLSTTNHSISMSNDCQAPSSMSSDIMKIVHSIKAPQVIVDTFDGSDNKKFHPFIKKFDLAMQGCDDFRYMTQMLLQSCKKDAGRDLAGILFISDPKKAYEEGRRILFEKYGDHCEIAYGIVNSLRTRKTCTSASDLRNFAADLSTAHRTLLELKMYERMMSDTVIREIVLKLPENLCRLYQKRALKYKKACGFYPDFHFVVDFVQECSDLANDKVFGQDFLDTKSSQNATLSQSSSKPKPRSAANAVSNATSANSSGDSKSDYPCPACNNGTLHKLWSCAKFKRMKVPERIKLVRDEKLCYQCLNPGHVASSCYRTTTCKVDSCGRKHTMWIHGIHDFSLSKSGNHNSAVHAISTQDSPGPVLIDLSTNQNASVSQSEALPVTRDSDHDQGQDQSLTATASASSTHSVSESRNHDLKVHMPIVNVIAAGNCVIKVGLDCFSSNTFCSERLIKAAGLSVYTNPGSLTLGTMSGVSSHNDIKCTDFAIQSMDRETTVQLSGVFVWDRIPVRCNYLDTSKFDHLRDLDLVTGEITEVDLLIGQDYSQCLLPLHTFKNDDDLQQPFAILTILGACLNGKSGPPLHQIGSNVMNTHVSVLNTTCLNSVPSLDSIEHDISRLYNIESPLRNDSWSQDDLRVIRLWENNHLRIGNKYQLPIPLKEPDEPIPNNYTVVKAICESLAKRLKRKGKYVAYDTKMKSLISDGYVEIIESDPYNNPNKTNYIPHFDVYHPRKTEPRIVHNAKFKYKGQSLNDRCLQGPNFLSRADSVLTRFRFHKFAFLGDIKAMYFQVIIPPEQRDLLRFLWFDDDGNLIHLRHCRHIFGGVWCSSSSQFVLRKSIENETNTVVKNAVLDGFYVDDCLTSVDEKAHLSTLVNELPETLDRHGYEITKILVNDPDVLSSVPRERRAEEVKDLTPTDQVHTYALGIRWEVNSDTFYFVFDKYDRSNMLTRRIVLSVVSSVYDPLGMISPLIIYGRILFQESNRMKLNWDEPLPESLIYKWDDWVESLQNISNLRIPRCVKLLPTNSCTLELHTFADASLDCYCAVSYVRTEDLMSENVTCSMIRSKTRVAPIKQLSIPRLELQACLMACQLSSMVRDDLRVDFDYYFWTDSKIALAYIMNDSKKFAPFVANRLTDINLLSAKKDWRYVSTHDNPADLGTRGKVLTHDELDNSTWFTGPEWLMKDKSEWPAYMTPELTDEAEMRRINSLVTASDSSLIGRIMSHYSRYKSMIRSASYLIRFISYLRKKPYETGCLTLSELKNGENFLIRASQWSSFSKEIIDLEKRKSVNKSSRIAQLSPFVDEDNILRVGGRTGANPILLQGSQSLSRIIIQYTHNLAHTGVEWTLALIRKRFWLTKGRAAIKSYIMSCVTCKRLYGKPQEQLMAPLPPERITPGLPVFSYVGIDLFGPFYIKNYRSEIKRYLCLFTCMTTRAVHLEVLFTLETSSMINGMRRFIARRGSPVKAISDRGTNLTGAYRDLRVSWKDISVDELQNYCKNGVAVGFEWEFISPKSPWKGGSWERLIGVSKRIAKGIRGVLNQNTKMNDEILCTLFCEVENIVNSRPLTKVNDDSNDFSFISPNHLLIGRVGANVPPGRFSADDTYRKAWRHAQHLACGFWKVWVKSYLPELQGRQKWLDIKTNLLVGDLVLILDENCPRNLWPLAIVTEVKVGRDDLVRSVKLRTRSNAELTRPIHKIVLLESKTPDYDKNSKSLHFKNVYK